MASLHRMGYKVQSFKHGPDFIDPGYHALATGKDSINLDFWMMGEKQIKHTFEVYMKEAEVGIVEGMGALFDGQNSTSEGSPAHLAAVLELPVVLVVDIYGMTRSVNALLQGFLNFDPKLTFAGIIFNRAGSQKHYEMVLNALSPQFRSLSLGYIPRFIHKSILERHLGLLTIEENKEINKDLEVYLKETERTLNLQPVIEKIEQRKKYVSKVNGALASNRKIRLGVAKDKAFCFYYKHNLNLLEKAGAGVVYFSPTNDASLPQNIDGLYFGGGYPESFAQQLSANLTMKSQIVSLAQAGMPIYAECGGVIYLCDQLLFEDETRFPMVGIFPYIIKWDKNYLAIRYIEAKTTRHTILGPAGSIIRGQEFHQTRFLTPLEEQQCCYEITSSTGEIFCEGLHLRNIVASYMHLYFSDQFADCFISECKKYQKEKYAHSIK